MGITESSSTALSGKGDAFIIVKATPNVSTRHGETVCCAAIDTYRNWYRLYPVSFRHLDEGKRFGRWDRVQFRWRKPKDDNRPESRRIDQDTLEITGTLPQKSRASFLANSCVRSLKAERETGRTLALLRPEIVDFSYRRRPDGELQEAAKRLAAARAQQDMFAVKSLLPYEPCPYRFVYQYRDDDGEHEGTCQDWETEATFFHWQRQYGEQKALLEMQRVFGEEYPKRGMVLAMGTHSRWPDRWLVNGVVRLDETAQTSLL